MKTIIRHIEYLLSRTDCVIIPGLGAILATDHSAMYDPLTHTIMPPSRSYTFNAEIRHNDGVLITSIQRAESISYEASRHHVNTAVNEIIDLLTAGDSIEIGNIGLLCRDQASGLTTLSTNSATKSMESLWLRPLYLRPIAGNSDNVIAPPIIKGRAFRRWLRAAASMAILLFIGFVASTPMPVDDAMLASLAPDLTQVPVEDIIPAKADMAPNVTDSGIVPESGTAGDIDVMSVHQQTEGCTIQDTAERSASEAVINDCSYYVVVASLANYDEANLYIKMHPGEDLKILERGRYIRVYTSAHDNLNEAYKASQLASKTYPGAWVCKK